MKLGKAITILRQRAGLRQAELASLIDISRTALSFIETDKSIPGKHTLSDISLVFGVEVPIIELMAIGLDQVSEITTDQINTLFPDFSNKVLLLSDHVNQIDRRQFFRKQRRQNPEVSCC